MQPLSIIRKLILTAPSLILFLEILPSTVYATHVLPIFSNFWYTDVAPLPPVSSCGYYTYQYTNKVSNSQFKQFIDEQLKAEPIYSNCTWQTAKCEITDQLKVPTDFAGTYEDLIKLEKAGQPGRTVCSRKCIEKDGTVYNQKSIFIFPSYHCPKDSFQNVYGEQIKGCDTTPPVCLSDVVARDKASLNSNSQSLNFGHLGIAIPPALADSKKASVLEVLNKDPAIEINTLDDFKKRTEFWGEKYHLPNYPNLQLIEALSIFTMGKMQMQFCPTYTTTWDFHPGGYEKGYILNPRNNQWKKSYGITCAKFRCDSFVYWAYSVGAERHIVDQFHFPYSPKDLFQKFEKYRIKPNSKVVTVKATDMYHIPLLNQLNYLPELSQALSATPMNIQQLDTITSKIVSDNSLATKYKVSLFWQMALAISENPNKQKQFSYLFSLLEIFKPSYLIPDLNELYNKLHNDNMQRSAIKLITSAAKPHNIEKVNKADILMAQKFLIEQAKIAKSRKTLRSILTASLSILTPEDALSLMELKRIKNTLSEKEFIMFQSALLLSKQKLQGDDPVDLLEKVQATNKKKKKIYQDAFCFYLKLMGDKDSYLSTNMCHQAQKF